MTVEKQPFEDVSPTKPGLLLLSCQFSGVYIGTYTNQYQKFYTFTVYNTLSFNQFLSFSFFKLSRTPN